jgi:polyisoprenoid-binding protein YceI
MNFMQKSLAALVVSLAAAAPALAAPVTYTVDNTHTFPRFSYSHFGYSTQLSRFDTTRGTVVYDAAAKTGSVDITIDGVFGGWRKAQQQHFADGGTFDRIYAKR